ncbi:hypothetical protein QUF80_00010 [Desulfococcaceae bacterium HSG8]|nr:hypothetical protein [Desulfococcaceae bacterium HSG8]
MIQDSTDKQRLQRYIISGVKISVLFIVLWFVSISLYNSVLQVNWSSLTIRPGYFICGTLIVISATLLGIFIQRNLYSQSGFYLSRIQTFILLTLPPIGKYLPGKVLSVAGYAAIAKSFGIEVTVSSSLNLLIMGTGIASISMIGLLLLLFRAPVYLNNTLQSGVAVILLIFIFILIYPGIYQRIMNFMLGLLKQPPVRINLNLRTMSKLFTGLSVQNGLYISGISVVVLSAVKLPVSFLPTLIGVSCMAYVAGFLIIFAPAGIGVREGILLVMLTPAFGAETASIIAIIMRLIQTVSDCLLATSGFILWHFLRHNAHEKARL